MIAGMLGEILLREVPKHLAAGVDSGLLEVFGSVVRDKATGQIAGFLQEAAPLSTLAQIAASPVTGTIGAVMDAGQLVQGEILRQGIGRLEAGMASLTQLGSINLALGVAGIGISVAGFALMNHRINRLQQSVNGLAGRLDEISSKVDQVRQDLIDADLATLRALAKALDENWTLADGAQAERQWHDVAKAALVQQSRFELRADHALGTVADFAVAEPMLDAIAFANGLRVAALAACNESVAAHAAADDGAKALERLTGSIGATDLVRADLADAGAEAGTPQWDAALAAAKDSAGPKVQQIRQREAAVATRTASLAAVEAKGVKPRDWLAIAREETEAPVLVMLPDRE